MDDYAPPPLPPPFLSLEQVHQLISHGFIGVDLPYQLASDCRHLFKQASAFFSQDAATKQGLYPAREGTELGWYRVPDEKEFLTLRHGTPSTPLESDAGRVWKQAAGMLYRILLDVGRALMIPPEAWQPVLDGCLNMPPSFSDSGPTLLRILRYLPGTGVADVHVDLGLLTLCFGSDRGLQVQGRGDDAEWEHAEGPTVLVGKTLHILSSGRVQAGKHRVIGNPSGRDSIVFPLRASTRNEIPLTPFEGWGSVHGRELDRIVREGRVNVNATKDIRERQRLELQRRRAMGQG